MGNAYELRLARYTDLARILGLITDASKWLRAKQLDQWQEPWPHRRGRDERVRDAVRADKTWILMDGEVAVATITADWQADPAPGLPALWDDYERAEPAVYAHRMAVRRGRAYQGRGIGAQLLNFIGRLGAEAYKAEYLRLDAWTTNDELHGYYGRLDFTCVRKYDENVINCPSGALFQKPTELIGDITVPFAVNVADKRGWSEQAAGSLATVLETAGTKN